MKKWLRNLIIAVAAVAFLILVVFGAWIWVTRQAYPKTRGRIVVEGLSAPVEIYRDRYGVPHIYAQTAEDLFFAQGLVHAQDRFWQMEFQRRLGAGRLSELFGEKLLETDKFLRLLGFARIAEQEAKDYDPEIMGYLEAYAAGVNAHILNRKPARLGLEFALLKLQGVDFEIEPWTPVHSLIWARMIAYDLGYNFTSERRFVRVLAKIGLPKWLDFFNLYRPDFPITVSDEEMELSGFTRAEKIEQPLHLAGLSEAASNAWVISGSRTRSGKPILANDMHLGIQMPSIWYEIGMHGIDADGRVGRTARCPFHMRGYSFLGIPGVIAGHNDRISWGYTAVPGDVQDLYIERVNPENPDQYQVNGEWVDMDISYEEIKIHKEDEPYIFRVRKTRHGPLLSDHSSWDGMNTYYFIEDTDKPFPENMGFTALALRWTALQPGEFIRTIISLDRVSNWQEFRQVMRIWDFPPINIAYADVEGNIGYYCPGLFPRRNRSNGFAPVPGWNDDYEWQGFLSFEELPYVLNPPKGYIVSANNYVTSPNYDLPQGSDFSRGYRAKRIVELIEAAGDDVTIEDAAVMQFDSYNRFAAELIPHLEDIDLEEEEEPGEEEEPESERKRRKREKKEQKELELMNDARERLLAWDRQMNFESSEAVLFAHIYYALVAETFEDQYPETLWPPGWHEQLQNVFYYLFQEPVHEWWDDQTTPEKRESRDEILAEAEPYNVIHISSQRSVYDMRELNASLFIHPTGQSGHPTHRHYDDYIEPYRTGEYHPNLWDRQAVEKSSRRRLLLKPTSSD